MKNLMITFATAALLFGGTPAMAQDVPTAGPENETSTSVLEVQNPSTAPAPPASRVEPPPINVKVDPPVPVRPPEVDVNVESTAPSAPSVQVIERSAPVTQSTTKETTTTRILQDDNDETASSDVGLFVILGGLGLIAALALFASSYSRGNTHTVRRETVVH